MEGGTHAHAEGITEGRHWDARFPSAGDFYAICLAGLFSLLVVVGIIALIRDPGVVVFPLIVGLVGLAVSVYVMWNPARYVVESADGSFTFSRVTKGKTWTVDAGDLISIQHYQIGLKLNNRMSPLVVTSRRSSFRFRPPFRDADSLIRALRDANPHARVDDWVRR